MSDPVTTAVKEGAKEATKPGFFKRLGNRALKLPTVAKWAAGLGVGALIISSISGAKRGAAEAIKEGQANAAPEPMFDPRLAQQPMALPPIPVQMPMMAAPAMMPAMEEGPAEGRAPGEWQARVAGGAEQQQFVQPAQNVVPESKVSKLAAKEAATPAHTLSA